MTSKPMNVPERALIQTRRGFDPVKSSNPSTINPPWAEGADWRVGKGKKKAIEPVPSILLEWPRTMQERRDLVMSWHAVAMGEIHKAGVSFRLIAVLKDFVHWKTGMIFPTNATLAQRAGGCSERTVSDLIAKYEHLGIIRLRFGWRTSRNGKWLQTRIIFMALPRSLSFASVLPDVDDQDQEIEFRIEDGVLGDLPRESSNHIEAGVLGGQEDGVLSTIDDTVELNHGGDDAA